MAATPQELSSDIDQKFERMLASREDEIRHRLERELIERYEITDCDAMHEAVTECLNELYANGLGDISDVLADYLYENHPDVDIEDLPDTNVNYSGIPFDALGDNINMHYFGIVGSGMLAAFFSSSDPVSSFAASLVATVSYYVIFVR